jgi:hypothetical protein
LVRRIIFLDLRRKNSSHKQDILPIAPPLSSRAYEIRTAGSRLRNPSAAMPVPRRFQVGEEAGSFGQRLRHWLYSNPTLVFEGVPAEYQPAPVSELSAVESYNILRNQLQHEDNLITQRLSWLMGSQAFLFTAYAIVLNGPERPKNALIGSLQDYLLGILPAVGLLSAVLIYVSIVAGVIAMVAIYRLAGHFCDAALRFPPLQGGKLTRYMGFASPLLLPPIFITVWLWIWAVGFPISWCGKWK